MAGADSFSQPKAELGRGRRDQEFVQVQAASRRSKKKRANEACRG